MPATIRKTGAALRAEIQGVDLAKEISRENFEAMRRALIDHEVIIFRGQKISDDDQIWNRQSNRWSR